ncbi:MAG: hypothetical protein C0625_00480 [Arcobacter sp.]|nr:MAG: hypothetical protein C0625_00480 [Arcobacter sp.]
MSSIDDVVNSFNIGFFSTVLDNKDSINFDIPKDSEFLNFEGSLKLISSTPYTPEKETRYLDGFDTSDSKHIVPTKIPITGHFQESFLDEYGNWDKKAEALAYKQREQAYKKEVIEDWMKELGYDLENDAKLMKALLEKVG